MINYEPDEKEILQEMPEAVKALLPYAIRANRKARTFTEITATGIVRDKSKKQIQLDTLEFRTLAHSIWVVAGKQLTPFFWERLLEKARKMEDQAQE